MKVSYRTHSIIKQIETGKFDVLVNPDDMELLNSLKAATTFREYAPKFNNIKIITKPFHDAVQLSIGKILQSDLYGLKYADSGTFLFKGEDGWINGYCYDFEIENGIFNHLVLYYFQDDCLVEFVNQNKEIRYVTDTVLENGITALERINMEISFFMEYYLFIKYAEIETKQLKPGQKIKDIDCKYINDTSSNIKILNSTWFTNLVKSDGFKVRGHFRLQPKKKDGEWTREIIWINEFEKTGYTAPARKLKEEAE